MNLAREGKVALLTTRHPDYNSEHQRMSTPVEDSAKGRRKRLPPGLVV